MHASLKEREKDPKHLTLFFICIYVTLNTTVKLIYIQNCHVIVYHYNTSPLRGEDSGRVSCGLPRFDLQTPAAADG